MRNMQADTTMRESLGGGQAQEDAKG
jgi:uncharacterized protein YqfA (UPF0365 family)